MLKNTSETYGSVSKFLHWAIFVLIVCMLCAGFFSGYIPKSMRGIVWNTHKVTGLLILSLMSLRFIWMLVNPKPRLPFGTKLWEKAAEHFVHYGLYAVVIAMPIFAWIGVSSAGHPPRLGDWKIALPIAKDKSLIQSTLNIHVILAWTLLALIVLHVGAALFHHFVKKDNVLIRMMPGERD